MFKLLISLVVGGIAGTIAGKITNSEGSMGRNIILGLVGGFVGGILLRFIGIYSQGIIGNIIVSVIGSCVLIGGYHLINGKK